MGFASLAFGIESVVVFLDHLVDDFVALLGVHTGQTEQRVVFLNHLELFGQSCKGLGALRSFGFAFVGIVEIEGGTVQSHAGGQIVGLSLIEIGQSEVRYALLVVVGD